MNTLGEVIRKMIDDIYAAGLDINVDNVVQQIQRDYPEQCAEEARSLEIEALKKRITRMLKQTDASGQGQQLQFDGIEVPSSLTIPNGEGGFDYRSINNATWEDSRTHMGVIDGNMEAVIAKRDLQHEAFERFRPIMEGHPEMTFGEAIRIMDQQCDM
jgi:hypothetical protein